MSAPVKDIARKIFDVIFKDSYKESFIKAFKYKSVRPGTLVGTDQFGNKYFQAPKNGMELRERWVEFAGKKSEFNATRIPPEWHTWMARVEETHRTPTEIAFEPQKYAVAFKPTELSQMAQHANYVPSNYHCKPIDVKPMQYSKQKYESWDPTAKSKI